METSKDIKRAAVSIGHANYTTSVKVRSHEFIIDEPLENEGQDLGPTPSEALLSGLGACTAITMKMYAQRKGWEVEGIDVHLTLDSVLERGEKITFIQEKIEIHGNLDASQRERLMAIAKKCPVYRTLTSPVEITAELV
ncbi:MAG: OsmC family protein [Bacteroidia bacterium]|nr:OsmC family protein [Bacteroidia bacterium]